MATEYRRLHRAIVITLKSVFYRRNPDSSVPWNVYDHGLLWRVLRDMVVVFGTLMRVAVGWCVIVTVLALLLPAAAGRAILIPILGALEGANLARKIGKAQRGAEQHKP